MINDIKDITSFKWATITETSPLAIKLDGDSLPLALVPDSLIDPLSLLVGDRVRVELSLRKVVIHGKSSGDNSFAAARNRNRIVNGNFRTNQRKVSSGVVLSSRKYGFDRWACSGVTNLIANPSLETDLSGWAVEPNSAITRVTSGGLFGASAMRLQFNSTTAGSGSVGQFASGLIIGQRYTWSVWAKIVSGSRRVLISTTLPDGTTFGLTSSWKRIRHTFTATAASQYLGVFPAQDGTGTGAAGDAVLLDGFMFTKGDVLWVYGEGTSGPSNTTLTWTADPHGQLVTIGAGGGLSQVIEQANVEAGSYVLSWSGTAQARVSNVGAAAPAFATSPIFTTLDGLDDVVVEVGPGTVGQVQLELGSAPTPFERIPVGQEMALCQRYYWRKWGGNDYMAIGVGVVNGAQNAARVIMQFPVEMRAIPIIGIQGIAAHDGLTVVDVTGGFLSGRATYGFATDTTGGGGMVAGRAAVLLIKTGATNYIEADAEF